MPDLTQGGVSDQSHDGTLGARGVRGWVWGWKCQTTDARQFLITAVAKGSPADGVLQPKDVLTGINRMPFTEDARVAFAKAVTAAEKEPSGVLNVARWRGGAVANVQLKLAVVGEYAATTPFGCPKSKHIFELGCEVQDAEKAALTLFPEIGTSGSKWNKAFLDRQKKLKQANPDAMGDPNWPSSLPWRLRLRQGSEPRLLGNADGAWCRWRETSLRRLFGFL